METIKKKPNVDQLDVEKNERILKFFIVDDDEYFNNILKSYVLKIGSELKMQVEPVAYLNGTDCLREIKQNPDFVLLDFYLDENNDITLTGYDVLEKIRNYNSAIKVIIISQKHEWEHFQEEFVQFGASGFLKKDEQLYANLKEMIRQNNIDLI